MVYVIHITSMSVNMFMDSLFKNVTFTFWGQVCDNYLTIMKCSCLHHNIVLSYCSHERYGCFVLCSFFNILLCSSLNKMGLGRGRGEPRVPDSLSTHLSLQCPTPFSPLHLPYFSSLISLFFLCSLLFFFKYIN